jgi:alkylglycerol monooxygenase
MNSHLMIVFAIPFFLLLMGLESLWGYAKDKHIYRLNDTLSNLMIGIGNQAFNLIWKAGILGIYVWMFEHFSLFQQAKSVGSFFLCLIAFDFLFYWAHRWGHEVNLFWGAHLVHHSSEEYNLSVALRQSWFHNLLAFFVFLPLPILGFDPVIFGAAAGVDTLYQFWIHTKSIGKLPRPIEWIFNTPSHHRVHHGRNPKYIDKNHAGMLIIWDRIFGTFQAEEEEVVYGITTPLKSWNPLWANLHYYVDLYRMAKTFSRWQDRLRLIFAPPGWKPAENGGYQSAPPLEKQDLVPYDANNSKAFVAYVVAQFSLMMVGLVQLMIHFQDLTWFYRLGFLTVIIATGMICGAILENRKWVLVVEYLRLTVVIGLLNAVYYQFYTEWFLYMVIGSGVGFVVFNLWFTLGWIFRKRALIPTVELQAK